jgi:hypothetical protein
MFMKINELYKMPGKRQRESRDLDERLKSGLIGTKVDQTAPLPNGYAL